LEYAVRKVQEIQKEFRFNDTHKLLICADDDDDD
jgi:hypothetical protein